VIGEGMLSTLTSVRVKDLPSKTLEDLDRALYEHCAGRATGSQSMYWALVSRCEVSLDIGANYAVRYCTCQCTRWPWNACTTLLSASPDTSDRLARHDRRHRTASALPCRMRTAPSAFFVPPLTLVIPATAVHVATFRTLVYNPSCLSSAKHADTDPFSFPLHFPRAFSVFRNRSLCPLNPDLSPNSLAAWTFHPRYNAVISRMPAQVSWVDFRLLVGRFLIHAVDNEMFRMM